MSEGKSNKKTSDETQAESVTDGTKIVKRDDGHYRIRSLNGLTIETRIDA